MGSWNVLGLPLSTQWARSRAFLFCRSKFRESRMEDSKSLFRR